MEEAHARLCERWQWALNEKRLIAAAGLDELTSLFAPLPAEPAGLLSWVNAVAEALTP